MALAITHRDYGGQTLVARIKRKADGKWWDQTNSTWDAAADTDSDITLSESAGVYAGSASFTGDAAGIYVIYIYDSSYNQLWAVEHIYTSNQDTALTLVQKIQRELKMPETTDLTDSHALLILSFINRIIRQIMNADTVWDELKVRGQVTLLDGIPVMTFQPTNNAEVDVIEHIQIGTADPIAWLSDEDFQEAKQTYTSEAQPIFARRYARAGGAVAIEFLPVPDQSYTADFRLLQKAVKLSVATDIPALNADLIYQGALALAKREHGLLSSQDETIFLNQLSAAEVTEDDSTEQGIDAI